MGCENIEEGGTISNQRQAKKEVRWHHEARTPKAEGEARKCKRGGNDDKKGVSCKLEEQNKVACICIFIFIYISTGVEEESVGTH